MPQIFLNENQVQLYLKTITDQTITIQEECDRGDATFKDIDDYIISCIINLKAMRKFMSLTDQEIKVQFGSNSFKRFFQETFN